MEAIELVVKVLLALIVVGFVGYPILKEDQGEEVVEIPEELQDLYYRKESTYSALKELEFDYKTGKLSEVDFRELDAKYRAEAIELLEAIESLEKGEESRPSSSRRPRSARRPAAAAAPPAPVVAETPQTEVLAAAEDSAAIEEDSPQTALEAAEVVAPKANGSPRAGSRPAGARKGKGRAGQTARAKVTLCEGCGSENQPSAKFCASCGEPLSGAANVPGAGNGQKPKAIACDECGAPVKPGHRFCGGCGAEVSV